MTAMTETDANLATLAKKVDDGFARADSHMAVEFAKVNGRIDTLAATTDQRFKRVDERFEDVDRRFDEVDRKFDAVDRRFDKVEATMKAGFEHLDTKFDAKFDALNRTMIYVGSGLIGTLIAAFAGLLTVLVTHG
jgi:hypothetical protein